MIRRLHDEVSYGNGKKHHTPSPQGLRKIKVVSLEVFLRLKELVNSLKVITPRGNRKKSILRCQNLDVIVRRHYEHEYEPSNATYVQDSLPWRWNRVAEWHRYINDPIDKIKGHMIT